MTTPPPLPRTGTRSSIYHQAATASAFAPLAAFVLNILLSGATASLDSSSKTSVSMIVGIFVLIILVGGLICGIVGLIGIRKYGKRGLLWKSLIGILIPLGLTLIAIPAILFAMAHANR